MFSSPSLSDVTGEEEGGARGTASGSSIRKETEARISASEDGFFVAGARRAAAGGRLVASGAASVRGRLRFPNAVSGFAVSGFG